MVRIIFNAKKSLDFYIAL